MDVLVTLASKILAQLQSATLGFLVGGMVIAALGTRLQIPNAIYQFIVFMLLMSIGLEGGMEIREADLVSMLVPAVSAVAVGLLAVGLGLVTLARFPGVKIDDALATAGLFGAVSSSTLAAGMVALDEANIGHEAWVPALYPFMDIPALILAIVLASVLTAKRSGKSAKEVDVGAIVKESLQGGALTALLLGLALGLLIHPERVFEEFYEPLFRGFLSILMLVMGMEAYTRLNELRRVAHWYAVYALFAPIVHGLMGFGFGYVAHVLTGFSPGGVVLLAVIASSNSDISGPPTLRAGIPSANPSAFIGASTSIGTPMAIAVCIPVFVALADIVFSN
ncbi:MAG TPA: sodium-dependent bicarbonate transport family permease [Myxococcales bacterium LLY-WYZ-16_1]|nr:sodium-dependent bicarbonate transport family permease [Myxococcales bacterium LLY-WYZ-16_1]